LNDLALERAAVELFEELYELPDAARAARLHAATKDWPELRERVEALLAAHQSDSLQTGGAGGLLEDEPPPERIGAYRIASLIGRGGMGSVYRAERMTGDFTHVAAVKIIRPGPASDALAERFRRERQLLAGLSIRTLPSSTTAARPRAARRTSSWSWSTAARCSTGSRRTGRTAPSARGCSTRSARQSASRTATSSCTAT
jgi:hypothetical protein